MSPMKTLVGFHSITSRLRQRPETVKEIYIDSERSDARMKELKVKKDELQAVDDHADNPRLA